MKFGVIVFPGSNCDHDAYHVISKHVGQPVDFIWHRETDLSTYDAVILPGGFSYADVFGSAKGWAGPIRFNPRLREMFEDMRLLWPALGATMAVLVCLSVAIGVLKSTSSERPSSLATRLEAMNPGSEANPLRPDNNARVDRYFDLAGLPPTPE